jgi:hypothetical protein
MSMRKKPELSAMSSQQAIVFESDWSLTTTFDADAPVSPVASLANQCEKLYVWGNGIPSNFAQRHAVQMENAVRWGRMAQSNLADPPLELIALGCPPRPHLGLYPYRYAAEIQERFGQLLARIKADEFAPEVAVVVRRTLPLFHELGYHALQGEAHLLTSSPDLADSCHDHLEVLRLCLEEFSTWVVRGPDCLALYILSELYAFFANMEIYRLAEDIGLYRPDGAKLAPQSIQMLNAGVLSALGATHKHANAHNALLRDTDFLDEVIRSRTVDAQLPKAQAIEVHEASFVTGMLEYHAVRLLEMAERMSPALSAPFEKLLAGKELFSGVPLQSTAHIVELYRGLQAMLNPPEAGSAHQPGPPPAPLSPRNLAAHPGAAVRATAATIETPPAESRQPVTGKSVIVILEKVALRDRNNDEIVVKASQLAGAPLPLFTLPNPGASDHIVESLELEFPYFGTVPRRILDLVKHSRGFSMKPVLLVGEAGIGKSRFVLRLCELAGVPYKLVSMSTAADSSFAGTSKQWNSARPSIPLQAILQHNIANPVVVLDELDKVPTGNHNGSVAKALLPMTERVTSSNLHDIGLDASVDVSYVSYIATANSLDQIDSTLRQRFEVITMPTPRKSDLERLAANLALGMQDDYPDAKYGLTEWELNALRQHWHGGSARVLSRMVDKLLRNREVTASRH